MELNLTIRKARIDDTETITNFNIAMALETEGKILAKEKISAGVENLFRHPEYGFYIVAKAGNRVVGCLLITYEWSDWRDGLIWWIQSVYIHPDFRRQGIYRKMYTFIKNLASSENNIRGFRLYVEKENRVAQNTYKNLGMEETGYNMYEEMLA
ncbi:MAG: N-acetyltransferase [Candidatus Marinimicrobia bacterium]|nr:N-acetyltransferase [Candidatus Neomarinimicrobiota bacterium]